MVFVSLDHRNPKRSPNPSRLLMLVQRTYQFVIFRETFFRPVYDNGHGNRLHFPCSLIIIGKE